MENKIKGLFRPKEMVKGVEFEEVISTPIKVFKATRDAETNKLEIEEMEGYTSYDDAIANAEVVNENAKEITKIVQEDEVAE